MMETVEKGVSAGTDKEAIPETANRGQVALVCLLFVLSGACGLAYEVVWSKYLGQFLGNTVLVYTAVLATFVAGLALGSLLIGRRANRFKTPLKIYGWLEVSIAAYALLFPTLSQLGHSVVFGAAASLPPGSPVLLGLKILVAVAMLALPTLLMGATFPVLTAYVERGDLKRFAERGANWLYFANCSGAVLGTLITGFYLIPELGLSGTIMGVAIANVLIGGLAILSDRSPISEEDKALANAALTEAKPGRTPQQKIVLLTIALSGATAFTYELVWTRLFAIFLGSSTYSFTLMLAAFITGLALGSVAANLLPTSRKPLLWFAWAEILIGLAIAVSVPFYPRLSYGFWQLKWMLRPVEESFGLFSFLEYGSLFLIMLVPTFLFGLTFPTAIRSATEEIPEGESITPHAASVYGWNTVGTLIGVVVAGALLIPVFGLMRSLQIAAAVNLLVAFLPLLRGGMLQRHAPSFALPAAVALALILFIPRWDPTLLTRGASRIGAPPPPTFAAYAQATTDRKMLFFREDYGTTVAVVSIDDTLYGKQQLLVVDGKTDASSIADMPSQVLMSQIPLFFKPDAKDIFVLGLGCGVTASSVLTHPVSNVDCVEISPAVVEAGKYFSDVNKRIYTDPRFKLYIDDGKTFLAGVPKQYDLIISEPTNPWIKGVGSLFTREAFESQKSKLKPGGVVAQWFHTYSLSDALVATILKTFREVFPHTLIFQGNVGDCIILGSMEPLKPDFAAMEQRMQVPEVKELLARIKITTVYGLLACQMHTDESSATLTEGGGLNTDDYPLLEYLAPRALYVGASAKKIVADDQRLLPSRGLLLEQYMAQHTPTQEDYLSVINIFTDVNTPNYDIALKVAEYYLTRWPNDDRVAFLASWMLERMGRIDESLKYATSAARLGNKDATALLTRIQARIQARTTSALFPEHPTQEVASK